jgi:hypothetical protein
MEALSTQITRKRTLTHEASRLKETMPTQEPLETDTALIDEMPKQKLRGFLLFVLMAMTLPLAGQRALFQLLNQTPSTPPVFQFVVGGNTGADTPATASVTCTATGHLLTAFVSYGGSADWTTFTVTGMTNLYGSGVGQQAYLQTAQGTCPDTSAHTYTFSYTTIPPHFGGFANMVIVETTGTLDSATPNNNSPANQNGVLQGNTTAVASSGTCLLYGLNRSWSPTTFSGGYTYAYNDGTQDLFYMQNCFSSPRAQSAFVNLTGSVNDLYPTVMVTIK